jgi:hypothetical protein
MNGVQKSFMAEPMAKRGLGHCQWLIIGKGCQLVLILGLVYNLKERMVALGRFGSFGDLDEDAQNKLFTLFICFKGTKKVSMNALNISNKIGNWRKCL